MRKRRERERMTRERLREQHKAPWDSEGEAHLERDERLEVTSSQDNERQATDSDLGGQLVRRLKTLQANTESKTTVGFNKNIGSLLQQQEILGYNR